MTLTPVQQRTVREIVSLLMQRPITEAIAMQVAQCEGFKHLEIANGNWVLDEQDPYMTGEEHAWIEALILHALIGWALANQAGRVYPGDMDFVLEGTPDHIHIKRQPDVAYVSNARVQATSGYYYGAPDLVVEIVSPSQSRPEMVQKANEYLRYGSLQVWLVFPNRREIEVHTAEGLPTVYAAGQTLSGGDLLPGFALDVAAVFES